MAGGVSARDARALAGQMSTDADMIKDQPKGTYATYIRGLTERAVPISIPFFVLENLPKASTQEIDAVREHSRKSYAEPWQKEAEHSVSSVNEGSEKSEKNRTDDPTTPSPEL